ncbi:hypothetical protein [Algoriphagus namhaensis]
MKNLKKIPLLAIFLGVVGLASAQEQRENQTLLKEGFGKNLGVMAAASLGPAQWNDANVTLLNLRAGAVFNDKFTIGAFYNLSANDFRPNFVGAAGPATDFRWVGGFMEYTLFSDRTFHLTFPLLIGGAEIEADDELGINNFGPEANFLLIEPSALLEINIVQNLRFNIGIGYRFASDFAYLGFDQAAVSGISAQAGLKVGLFKK